MKKSLLALAALSAFTTTAQAQSSVTAYGQIDLAYGSDKSPASLGSPEGISFRTHRTQSSRLVNNHIGLKGVEDFGNGMKAGFTIETKIYSNYEKSAINQGFLSLTSNDLGEIRYGKMPTLDTKSSKSFIAGTDCTMGHSISHGRLGGDMNGGNLFSDLKFTGFQYDLPKMDSIQISIEGSADGRVLVKRESKEEDTKYKSNQLGISATYTAHPVAANITYTNMNYKNYYSLRSAKYTPNTEGKFLVGSGSYDFGYAKLLATVGNRRTKSTNLNAAQKFYNVGVQAPIGGKTTMWASLGNAKTDVYDTKTFDQDVYQIGIKYNLSKRTALYAVHGLSKNDLSGPRPVADKSSSIGITHNF